MFEIKHVSEDEIHIFTYIPFNQQFIVVDGKKFELIQMESDKATRKRKSIYAHNYF